MAKTSLNSPVKSTQKTLALKNSPSKSKLTSKKLAAMPKKSRPVKEKSKKGKNVAVKETDESSSGGSAADEDEFPAKIYCRPLNLAKYIRGFTDEQREAIREIGFGGLLEMKLTKFPKSIIPLLIRAFSAESLLFTANEKKEFLLSMDDVHDCFLIPMGPNPLEVVETGRHKLSQTEESLALKRSWSQRYGINDPTKGIPLGSVARTLTNYQNIDDFKKAFVLYSMGIFLAPPSTSCIDLHLLKAVEDVDMINTIDWCSYVFDNTVDAFRRAKSRDKNSISGCIPFVMIAYFHRFAFRGEELPSTLPLIQHWTYESISKRVKMEMTTNGLGNAPLSAVQYPICSRPITPGN